jgi:hypothetical protein
MKLDKLIIRLQRLGYRTQTIGDEIAVNSEGRSAVRGSKNQIEKLLPSLTKKKKKTRSVSTWSLSDHPEYKPPAERIKAVPESPNITNAIVVDAGK